MKRGGKIENLLREAGALGASGPAKTPACPKDPSLYRDRIRALPGAETVAEKTAVVVGLGSVGSESGARLVQLGVNVLGFDPDVLAVENLIRWGLPASIEQHVGLPKATVWEQMLLATVPGARAKGHVLDVVEQASDFDALIAATRPDLLIAATDTADSRGVVNAMAALHGVPALFVGLADGAASVRIEIVEDAARGPCHLCALAAEGGAARTSETVRRSRTPYEAEEAAPDRATAVPALPIDVALGALLATRVALRMLAGEPPRDLLRNGRQRGNVLFFSLRPGWWVFEDAWDRLVYQVERDPDCAACGRAEGAPLLAGSRRPASRPQEAP
jgi:hypothetical protein